MECPLLEKCSRYGKDCRGRDFLNCHLHIDLVLDKMDWCADPILWKLTERQKDFYVTYCFKHYGRCRQEDLD